MQATPGSHVQHSPSEERDGSDMVWGEFFPYPHKPSVCLLRPEVADLGPKRKVTETCSAVPAPAGVGRSGARGRRPAQIRSLAFTAAVWHQVDCSE